MAISLVQAASNARAKALGVAARLGDPRLREHLGGGAGDGGSADGGTRCDDGAGARYGEDARDQTSTLLMDLFRRSRDLEAFECLYELNVSGLRRLIQSRIRHFSVFLDVNDILQDAFFNIYRYPRQFRADRAAAFRTWAGSIVQNTIRRHLKRQLRRDAHREQEFDRASERIDPHGEPSDVLAAREQLARIRRGFLFLLALYLGAYEQLGDRDRLVLHLVEVEGLLYRQAAERIGVRPENMKMLVFRARQKIARAIAARVSGEPSKLSA